MAMAAHQKGSPTHRAQPTPCASAGLREGQGRVQEAQCPPRDQGPGEAEAAYRAGGPTAKGWRGSKQGWQGGWGPGRLPWGTWGEGGLLSWRLRSGRQACSPQRAGGLDPAHQGAGQTVSWAPTQQQQRQRAHALQAVASCLCTAPVGCPSMRDRSPEAGLTVACCFSRHKTLLLHPIGTLSQGSLADMLLPEAQTDHSQDRPGCAQNGCACVWQPMQALSSAV